MEQIEKIISLLDECSDYEEEKELIKEISLKKEHRKNESCFLGLQQKRGG